MTGANFGLDMGGHKLLIDCGAHERENICDPKNHEPFPYDVKAIDTLIITHAHQDHIGLVPKIVREGFKGVIISTPATKELAAIMLDDALTVMQTDAERSGCGPLFEEVDVAKALTLWETHPYHTPFTVGDATAEFLDAGHILGSAMVKLSRGSQTSPEVSRSIIFTGDLGNSPEPLLNDIESPEGANYILMESVYGDKLHEEKAERREILRKAVDDARKRDGALLIPCFSLERTQIILFEIHQLIEEGKLQPIPMYLDAPLAQRVSEVYRAHIADLNPAAREAFAHGDAFTFPKLVEIVNPGESHHIHRKAGAKVIIAGAGMSNGGRIRAHELAYLPDPNAAVLITGYQAPGSLGRRIQDGAAEVQIDRTKVHVRAHISALTGYSGHADRDALLSFVEAAGESLERVFVTMGEPASSQFLAQRIRDFLGVEAIVPAASSTVEIAW